MDTGILLDREESSHWDLFMLLGFIIYKKDKSLFMTFKNHPILIWNVIEIPEINNHPLFNVDCRLFFE